MRSLILFFFMFSIHFVHAQLQFDEVASSKGINVSYGPSSSSIFGAGISFVDFDGDG